MTIKMEEMLACAAFHLANFKGIESDFIIPWNLKVPVRL